MCGCGADLTGQGYGLLTSSGEHNKNFGSIKDDTFLDQLQERRNISGSSGGEYEDDSFLEYGAV
jgi:hypothetical protein